MSDHFENWLTNKNSKPQGGENSGPAVERRSPDRELGGSKPTSAVLCP